MAVVAVANGDGLKRLFTDFGWDYIIDGGQTGNLVIFACIASFDAVDNIIVLPNNSNIVLTAKQVTKCTRIQNYVVPSNT